MDCVLISTSYTCECDDGATCEACCCCLTETDDLVSREVARQHLDHLWDEYTDGDRPYRFA